MIVRAVQKSTGSLYAIKLFYNINNTQHDGFLHEKMVNEKLINQSNLIIAEKCVPFRCVKAPLVLYKSRTEAAYSYIVVPYQKKKTLLNLIQKASLTSKKCVSLKTVKFLWSQMVKCAYNLTKMNSFAHRDIKLDNFVIKSDNTLGLIDFGQCIRIRGVG